MKRKISKRLTGKVKSIIAAILISATFITLFGSCSVGKEKIKLKDYVAVEFSSFNHHGKASLKVDYDELDDFIDDDKITKLLKKSNLFDDDFEYGEIDYERAAERCSFDDLITIDFPEEYESLSNNDTVIVTASVSDTLFETGEFDLEEVEKILGISIKDAEFKVEGLVDAKEIDFFAPLKNYISFSGVNGSGKFYLDIPDDANINVDGFYLKPYGSASCDVIYENRDFGYLTLEIENDENAATVDGELSKGDLCTIKLTCNAQLSENLEKLSCVVKNEKEIMTVPDLGYYVTSESQLTQTDLQKIKNSLIELIDEEYDNSQLLGMYFASVNPGVVCDEKNKGKVVCIAQADQTIVFTTYRKAHISEAYNIIKNDSGELSFESQRSWSSYSGESEAVEGYDNNYSLTKIS